MALSFRVKIKKKRKRLPPSRLQANYKKDLQNMLRRIGAKGINNIRSEIRKRDLINTGNMLKNVGYRLSPRGVKFEVRTNYAKYLEDGVRRHQMKYLLKSKKPIPIDAANGIFRWASPKSMKEKKWTHPGFKKGRGFMSESVKRTRKDLGDEIAKMRFKIF
jgi:hypothetical protein